jgi:hypothetical protein
MNQKKSHYFISNPERLSLQNEFFWYLPSLPRGIWFPMKTAVAVFMPVCLCHFRLIGGSYENGLRRFHALYICVTTGIMYVFSSPLYPDASRLLAWSKRSAGTYSGSNLLLFWHPPVIPFIGVMCLSFSSRKKDCP